MTIFMNKVNDRYNFNLYIKKVKQKINCNLQLYITIYSFTL